MDQIFFSVRNRKRILSVLFIIFFISFFLFFCSTNIATDDPNLAEDEGVNGDGTGDQLKNEFSKNPRERTERSTSRLKRSLRKPGKESKPSRPILAKNGNRNVPSPEVIPRHTVTESPDASASTTSPSTSSPLPKKVPFERNNLTREKEKPVPGSARKPATNLQLADALSREKKRKEMKERKTERFTRTQRQTHQVEKGPEDRFRSRNRYNNKDTSFDPDVSGAELLAEIKTVDKFVESSVKEETVNDQEISSEAVRAENTDQLVIEVVEEKKVEISSPTTSSSLSKKDVLVEDKKAPKTPQRSTKSTPEKKN